MSDSAILRGLSTAVGVGSKLLPGKARTIGGIIAEGIALAADFAKVGRDPAVEIRRVRSIDKRLVSVNVTWQAALQKRLGEILAHVPEDSREDVYADLEKLENL